MEDDFEESKEQEKGPWDKRLQDFFDSLTPYLLRVREKRKKWLIVNAIGAVIIVLGILLFAKPYYDVSVDILPDYGNKTVLSSGLGGLASLGSSLGGISLKADPNEIYENIIQSESVLLPVIQSKYLTEKFKDSVNLVDYFEIKSENSIPESLRERRRLLKLLDRFQKVLLQTDVVRTTKILTVTIRMPESKLASDVVNNVVASLDRYVRTQRKSYASNQHAYLEKRIKEVLDSLTLSEERFRSFKEKNFSSGATPKIVLEGSRLSRDVDLLQSVYSDLTRQLELVKLDEVKDVPILNIQELAGDPVIKTGPSRTKWSIVLMFFYASFVTIFFSFSPEIRKGGFIIKTFLYRFR
jgi:uncharacterized protein involved in exopolysaccharide biosynthesis